VLITNQENEAEMCEKARVKPNLSITKRGCAGLDKNTQKPDTPEFFVRLFSFAFSPSTTLPNLPCMYHFSFILFLSILHFVFLCFRTK
jgi:hypothetical protein